MAAHLLSNTGSASGSADIGAELAAQDIKPHLIHEAVTAEMAWRRAGTASTKTRSDVRGGGAKPWRQKGTGRARAGSNRSPIWTGGGDDLVIGGAGNDVLSGESGNDTIFGGDGFDFIVGGRGADRLTGGADSDVFVFTQFEESRSGAGNRDVITDFTIEQDIIDLSRLSQAGVNIAFAYDTGDGFALTPVGDFDFSRELVDVVLFTEITATGTLVRALHFDVYWFGRPDPGTADTDFEIEVLGVFGLDLFNFDTGFNRG